MCIRDRFWFAHLGETHLGTEGEVSHPFTGRNREQFRSSCATNRCPGKPKPSDGGGGGEYRQELPSRPWIHSGPINRRHIHLHLLFQALTARGASLDTWARSCEVSTDIVRRIALWRWARASSGRSKRDCGSRTPSWQPRRGIRFTRS